ncbi:MAG TPA: alpha-(1-_3)-arabinofuranosyltransferase family protein [Dermatophilaceae bacterium]|nr:alpha-(1->3)-arabinofuranosyltransferase family protein [Dermatophilaceae bacterium]
MAADSSVSSSRRFRLATERSDSFVWRVRHVVVCLFLSGFAMASDSGRMVADTKLDLVVDPVGFLVRGIRLWDPMGAAGQLQNQAYGYLFPMGPFFAVGHALRLPEWVVQRLWWALVLCTAYTGVVMLAKRLGVESHLARMVGAAAFAVSPHVLTVLGPVSAEAWPMALSAWVLVPLVGVNEHGSIRRAAFRSGLAVLCMGGINAVLTLTALVPAGMWLVTRRPGVRLVKLASAWVAAVVLASLWWLVPLLLLGRYSPPFLDYIESASVTTSTTSLVEVLRGTHDWVAYFPGSGWSAGLLLLTSSVLVLNTALVAAGGLAGLGAVRTPHRPWLVACLLVGVLGVTLGHVGAVSGLGSEAVRGLLDGPLAPLRNVHKFDVALRLPLSLGLVLLVDRAEWGRGDVERRVTRGLVAAAAAFAVAGAGVPLVAARVAPAGSFAAIPAYWRQTAAWLGSQQPQGRALLVPGSRFAVYDWGTTNDEPLQALATSPWDVRNAVPLTEPGHIRWLDSVEAELAAGRGSVGLARSLARGGFTHLVVRNDLDAGKVGATRAIRVHQALGESPGISRVATFGPDVGSQGVPTLVYDQHLRIPYPAVEVYAVDTPDDPRVSATPLSSARRLAGGPEVLTSVLGDGSLLARPTVIMGQDPTADRTTDLRDLPVILTDTPRRREANFAAGVDGYSATLTPSDALRIDKPQRDYTIAPGVAEAAARTIGGRLTASSSASDPGVRGGSDPGAMPFSAVDGDPQTAWRPNPGLGAVGAWLRLDFDRKVDLSSPVITFLPNSKVARVTVFSGRASVTTQVRGASRVHLRTPHPTGRDLRVRIDALLPGADRDTPLGIVELAVPGVHIERTVDLPRTAATSPPALIALTTSGRRDACAFVGERPLCATGQTRLGEDAAGMDRSFATGAPADYTLTASAVPLPGTRLNRLIAEAVHPKVSARASSVAVPDPYGSAASSVDGDPGTAWVASPDDADPTLRLAWSGSQEVRSLKLVLDQYAAGTRPTEVVVTSDQGTQRASVAVDGTVALDPVKTSSLVLHLRARVLASSFDPSTQQLTHLGMGVSEVLIPGVHGLASADALETERQQTVTIECGSTPPVVIDGKAYRTAAAPTIRQLRRMEPVPLTFCDGAEAGLDSGEHRVVVASDPVWAPHGVELAVHADSSGLGADGSTPSAAASAVPSALPSAVDVEVLRWGPVDRAARIPARSEPVLLTVRENANQGWAATLDGKPLQRLTVDGWQQGYVVPPGAAGVVQLVFTPDRGMGVGLAVSGAGLVALWAGALLPARRWRRLDILPWPRSRAVLGALGVVTLALVGGVWGLVLGLLGAALVLALRRWVPGSDLAPAMVSAGLYAVAGGLLALSPWGTAGYGAGHPVTQGLCLLSIAVLVFSVATSPRWIEKRG